MDYNLIQRVREIVQPYYLDVGGHGFDHIERVLKIGMRIAERENADTEVVALAVLLHDSARLMEDRGECKDHSEEGAKIAQMVLSNENYPQEKIDYVKSCIMMHRYSKGLKPDSIEARVLQDVDRLEALGAICIARVFTYNGYRKLPMYDPDVEPEQDYHGQETNAINHFYEKILRITPDSFNTEIAREMAKGRYTFIETFLEQFKFEWEGRR